MKKTIATACAALASLILLCAVTQSCGRTEKGLLPEGKITRISVRLMLPLGEPYVFEDEESIGRIADYFSGVSLKTDFKEDPLEVPFGDEDESWEFRFEYEDDSLIILYVLKSVYVKNPHGAGTQKDGWYKTSRSDGKGFEKMIKEIKETKNRG